METGIHELTAGYALDALEPEERRAYEAHLEGCEQCREELAAFWQTTEALAVAASGPTPSRELRERILAGAHEEPQVVVPLESRRRRTVPVLAAAAAVAAVVALALEAQPGGLLGRLRCLGHRSGLVGERLGASSLLPPYEVDRPAMHEREHPGARLRALGAEGGGSTPDGEEPVLHGVLGEAVVAQHAQREPVRDAPDPIVELGEGILVPPGDERDQGLVREVGVLPANRRALLRAGERYHGGCELHRPHSPARAVRFGALRRSNRRLRRREQVPFPTRNRERSGDAQRDRSGRPRRSSARDR